MLKLKDEAELSKLGLTIHPGDPTKAMPLNVPDEAVPDDSWSLDQLGQFVAAGLAESNRLDAEAACLSRKSTVKIFWAGRALMVAKDKVKEAGKKWTVWLKQQNIPRTNAWEAEELFKRAVHVNAIANLTPTEAKKVPNQHKEAGTEVGREGGSSEEGPRQ